MLNQLSVFVENKPGRLLAVLDILAENDVDISALSLADSSEFGVLRLIVDRHKTEQSVAALRQAGVMVKATPVIAAGMDNRPGSLARITRILTEAGISIEYMYAFIGRKDAAAWTVFKVDAPERAVEALDAAGVQMLNDAKTIQ